MFAATLGPAAPEPPGDAGISPALGNSTEGELSPLLSSCLRRRGEACGQGALGFGGGRCGSLWALKIGCLKRSCGSFWGSEVDAQL